MISNADLFVNSEVPGSRSNATAEKNPAAIAGHRVEKTGIACIIVLIIAKECP